MTFIKTDGPDHCRNLWVTHFLTQGAVQFWSDFMVWERFLDANPAKHFIELGTGSGGLSLFLALQCVQRNMRFDTFDAFLSGAAVTPVGKLLDLEGKSHVGNLWTEAGEWLREMLRTSEHPLILFCDNGDKPKEFRLFGPLLQPGDIIAVHDFENEFSQADVPGDMVNRVERIFEKEAAEVGSLTVWYRIKA